MYTDFAPIPVFLVLSVAFILFALFLQKLLSPAKPGELKNSPYECGEEIEGPAWVEFNIRFYVIALIFLIFDVEVVLLFPWAVVFQDIGMIALVEMLVFLGILTVGLVAVWIRHDLDWVKVRVHNAGPRYARLDTASREAA